jgi:hypothetical protein
LDAEWSISFRVQLARLVGEAKMGCLEPDLVTDLVLVCYLSWLFGYPVDGLNGHGLNVS